MHSCCGQARPGATLATLVTALVWEGGERKCRERGVFSLISSTVVRVQLNFTLSTACVAPRPRKRRKRGKKEREGEGDMRQATR